MRLRSTSLALCFVAAGALAACGSGGSDGDAGGADGDGNEATCVALDELGQQAQSLEQANVADPDAFADALDRAVTQFTHALDELRDIAPDELQDPIDDLDRAVSRRDFDRALTARGPLDAFIAAECGAPPPRRT